MRFYCSICVVFVALFLANRTAAQESIHAFDIRTPGGDRIFVQPEGKHRLTVVCFLGTECPLAKLYAVRLNELKAEFGEDVFVLGLDSNRQDSEEEVAAFVQQHKLNYPIAKDHRNQIADQFQATRTPEVFLLDNDLAVQYRGRIDDQYEPGVSRNKSSRNYLRDAIRELLDGKPITVRSTDVAGCLIGRIKEADNSSSITFSNQISRLLQKHCVECHRAGDIGPMSLTDYEEVVGWSDMLVEVVDEGRMPPWHANPAHGEFVNAREMPESDKEILRQWVDAGAPFGDPKELPAAIQPVEGWELAREPDVVVSMNKPFTVPAEGTVDYQYFVVDPGFTEDKWVVGAQVLPGNRSVVHHSIVFVRPPDWVRMDGIGWLGAYVPGQRQLPYPPGHGRLIPAGSKFVFQQHYTPVGSEQTDTTKVGIVFGDESKIDTKVYTLMAVDQDFEIPPGNSEYPVSGKLYGIPVDGTILAMSPHMHFRGKSFRVSTKKNGQSESEILLDVPSYDFNWQHLYALKEPLPLADIQEVSFDATFDNSANNPFNPDPTAKVFWGDQTWEEMAVVFFEVAESRAENVKPIEDPGDYVPPVISAREKKMIDAFVDDFFEKFDKNNDGIVTKQSELPFILRRYGYGYFENDGNGEITREELNWVATEMYYNFDELEAAKK